MACSVARFSGVADAHVKDVVAVPMTADMYRRPRPVNVVAVTVAVK
jgi:hypothetical protein